MTPADAAELLTLAAAFDRRTVGEADARAWAAALNATPFDDDAREAVARHYAETDRWLTPAHVRQQRAKIRAERIATANVFYDGRPDETGAESITRRRALERAVADGRIAPQTVTQGVGLAPGTAPRALTGAPAVDPELVERLAAIGRTIPDDAAEQLRPYRPVRAERESLAAHGQPDPLDVPCPYGPCRAAAAEPCRMGKNRARRRATPHPSRLEAATYHHRARQEQSA
ncbi:zinc finger domain-containing protein [Streptomyces antimycoticus]|uniref:zinc finger domain-containing protein n=1 Tax=Streptomyces antimycoticus TaxID=68175 RepID=UPI0033D995D2